MTRMTKGVVLAQLLRAMKDTAIGLDKHERVTVELVEENSFLISIRLKIAWHRNGASALVLRFILDPLLLELCVLEPYKRIYLELRAHAECMSDMVLLGKDYA